MPPLPTRVQPTTTFTGRCWGVASGISEARNALARLDRRLLSACNPEEFDGADVGVHVWDLDRRTLESVLPVGGGVFTLDVSPDGELLLVGLRSGYVEVWLCPRS